MEPSELPAIPVAPPTGPDPSKDTMKVISASGKFDYFKLVYICIPDILKLFSNR